MCDCRWPLAMRDDSQAEDKLYISLNTMMSNLYGKEELMGRQSYYLGEYFVFSKVSIHELEAVLCVCSPTILKGGLSRQKTTDNIFYK